MLSFFTSKKTYENKIKDLEQEIDELRIELEKASGTTKSAINEKKKLVNEIKVVKKEALELLEENKKIAIENGSYVDKILVLEKNFKNNELKLNKLRDSENELKEAKKIIKKYELEKLEISDENENLKKQKQELTDDLKVIVAASIHQTHSLKNNNIEKKKWLNKEDSYKEEIKALNIKITSILNEKMEFLDKYDELFETNQELLGELDEYYSLENELEVMEEEIQKLEEELSEAQEKIQELEDRMVKIDSKVENDEEFDIIIKEKEYSELQENFSDKSESSTSNFTEKGEEIFENHEKFLEKNNFLINLEENEDRLNIKNSEDIDVVNNILKSLSSHINLNVDLDFLPMEQIKKEFFYELINPESEIHWYLTQYFNESIKKSEISNNSEIQKFEGFEDDLDEQHQEYIDQIELIANYNLNNDTPETCVKNLYKKLEWYLEKYQWCFKMFLQSKEEIKNKRKCFDMLSRIAIIEEIRNDRNAVQIKQNEFPEIKKTSEPNDKDKDKGEKTFSEVYSEGLKNGFIEAEKVRIINYENEKFVHDYFEAIEELEAADIKVLY